LSEQQLVAQVETEVQATLPLVEPLAPVVQHQQTSERALPSVALAETAGHRSLASAESLESVALHKPLHQRRQQQSAAPAATEAHPL
jgi:hypothetical protein